MERSIWNLRVDPPSTGAANMRVDAELLSQAEESSEWVTWVRLYQWARPTVSLGQHQNGASAVDLDFCQRAGVDVVRRPTGGRAVLHQNELTYAVVSNDSDAFPPNVDGAYRTIAAALLAGLARLGIEAEMAAAPTRERASSPARETPCFASATRHEILWRGRKLVGSAQRRLKRSFLQHGSLPLEVNWELMSDIFRMDAALLQASMVDLKEILSEPSIPRIGQCLAGGFEDAFGVEFRPANIPSGAVQSSADWTV